MAVVANKTSTPTNDRSLRQGIAEFLDYNSNPDNPPIMTGGAGKIPAEIIEFIMDAVLGSRRTDLPTRATTPKKGEAGASRQPGGYIVTDTTEDARTYAKLGSGGDVDPNYGQFYDVRVNPEGIENVLNLDRSTIDMLRSIRGSGPMDYRATGDQRTADDILKFLENQSAYYVPKLFSRNMADALQRQGIGGLMFPTKSGTGIMPNPTRGIISYQKPVYLTPLGETQNIKRQQEAAAELLKPELSQKELVGKMDNLKNSLKNLNIPGFKYDRMIKLEEADEVLKEKGKRKVSLEKYKDLKKFKDKFDPED